MLMSGIFYGQPDAGSSRLLSGKGCDHLKPGSHGHREITLPLHPNLLESSKISTLPCDYKMCLFSYQVLLTHIMILHKIDKKKR
jgi:hypothetical protein